MTRSDFDKWIRYHGQCQGGFTEWLAKGRDDAEQREVLAVWLDALSDVDLRDARAASLAMMRGELERTAFGEHPATIRREARRLASERARTLRRINGHYTVACVECQDSGHVLCYHPVAIREFCKKREAAFMGIPPRRIMPKFATCGVSCYCTLGGTKRKSDEYPTYNADQWIKVTKKSYQEQLDELCSETDKRILHKVENMPNYDRGLAEWSTQS